MCHFSSSIGIKFKKKKKKRRRNAISRKTSLFEKREPKLQSGAKTQEKGTKPEYKLRGRGCGTPRVSWWPVWGRMTWLSLS